ncbi:MAG: hypothetical protein Kow0060_24480 [Methylohalobius crimeensis]
MNIVSLGPTFSNHFPPKAAERPKNRIAKLKTHPSVVNFQSSGEERLIPMTRVNGSVNIPRQSRGL